MNFRNLLDVEDQNLFFVDWNYINPTFVYPNARMRVEKVAEEVGSFVNFLHDHAELRYENVTLIGFSLGAHVAGLAGKKYINGEIGKVVGLDPAGPSFDVNDPDERLSPESAAYTECIHTGYVFGIRDPICHADFYINSGANQPGCKTFLGTDFVVCSHARVIEIYIEALHKPNGFYGFACENLDDAINMNCTGDPGAFINNEANAMNKLIGIFHVTTNGKPPYSQGRP